MYLLYLEYYGDLIIDTGQSGEIIGLFSTKEKAIKKAKEIMQEDMKENNYVLDKERNNIEEEYAIMWYNNQENWSCYYDIVIEKLELDKINA